MLNIDKVKQVYLAVGVTDLRKSIDGLSAIAAVSFKLDVYENGGSIGITMEEFKWILKGYEARTVNKLNMEKGGKIY